MVGISSTLLRVWMQQLEVTCRLPRNRFSFLGLLVRRVASLLSPRVNSMEFNYIFFRGAV